MVVRVYDFVLSHRTSAYREDKLAGGMRTIRVTLDESIRFVVPAFGRYHDDVGPHSSVSILETIALFQDAPLLASTLRQVRMVGVLGDIDLAIGSILLPIVRDILGPIQWSFAV